MHLAVSGGNETVTRLLLEAGARFDISTGGFWGTTQGFVSNTGNAELVKLFLDAGADVNADTGGLEYRSMLSIAAAGDNERLVKLLLDRGANVNAQRASKNGENPTQEKCPLLAAADRSFLGNNNVQIIKLLLEHGADPNTSSTLFGKSVLNVVIKGHMTTDRDMQGSTSSRSPLEQSFQLLLEKRAKLNVYDAEGKPPLWWALYNGSETMTRLLLDNGADPNLYPVNRLRPLSLAALNGNETQVRLLLDAGADPDVVEDVGLTPLSVAALQGHKSMERVLLEKGACANSGNIRDSLALAIAKSDFRLANFYYAMESTQTREIAMVRRR